MAGTGSEIGDAMTVLTILLAVTFAVLVSVYKKALELMDDEPLFSDLLK